MIPASLGLLPGRRVSACGRACVRAWGARGRACVRGGGAGARERGVAGRKHV